MPPLPRLPNLATLITPLIKRGVEMSEGIALMQAQGIKAHPRVLEHAWGQVVASIGKRGAVGLAPLSRRPGPEERTIWNTSKSKGYLYQMEIQMQIPGTNIVATRLHSVRTQKLITYGSALEEGLVFLTDVGSQYNETVIGGVVTGVFELRGKLESYSPLERKAIERYGEGVRLTEVPLFGGGVAVRGAGGKFVGGIRE